MSQDSIKPVLHGYEVEVLGDQILIEVEELNRRDESGLNLYEDSDDYHNEQKFHERGRVIAMGPHAYEDKYFPEGPWVKVGDLITFKRYAGDCDRDETSNKVYRIIKEKDPKLRLVKKVEG